jgi:hypothetical protein
MNWKGFRRRRRCLTEVLPEVTRVNQENLSLDSNRISPEYNPWALPLHQPALYDGYDAAGNDTSNTTTTNNDIDV